MPLPQAKSDSPRRSPGPSPPEQVHGGLAGRGTRPQPPAAGIGSHLQHLGHPCDPADFVQPNGPGRAESLALDQRVDGGR